MRNFAKSMFVLSLVSIGVAILLSKQIASRSPIEQVDYTSFMKYARDQRIIGDVKIRGNIAYFKYRSPASKQPVTAQTQLPETPDQFMFQVLREASVNVYIETSFLQGIWGNLLLSMVPVLAIVGLWMFFLRQSQIGSNQALSFGKSRARRLADNLPKVTFEDVAGVEEAKQELQEVIEFLKDPEKFQALGAKIPKGVLLLGSPGTGKTLLARAIAGEAGVPFFHISGSDFVEMFVGVGASRVRDLFDQAKQHRPCIVFIDEIDAVGRHRGAGLGGGHDEREQTLNQLLVEMDGFDPNIGVIIVAATNRPDVLDPALLRPGRFDRRVIVDNPDQKGRRAIFGVHTKGKPMAEDMDLDVLARRTPGFSGADIANCVNEAALLAARRNKKAIGMSEFEEAVEKVVAGPERKSRVINEREKRIIAYHEAGHALVARLTPQSDPVHKVTILPRGMALGYVLRLPLEDKFIETRSELIADITVALGGMVSEKTVFNELATGSQSDLEKATEIARRMVCEFGMSDKLGPLTLGRRHGPVFLGRDLHEDRNYSEEVAAKIDQEIRNIIDVCYREAERILTEHRDKLDRIVERLLEKETIDGEELAAIMNDEGASPTTATPPTVPPTPLPAVPVAEERPQPKPVPRLLPPPMPA